MPKFSPSVNRTQHEDFQATENLTIHTNNLDELQDIQRLKRL